MDEGNARTKAPAKYASAHDLRRTFAIRLRNADLPPELIRKLMRHSDIKTTERYYLTDDIQYDAGRLRSILQPSPKAGYEIGYGQQIESS